jgi:hypothetical protein
MTQYLLSVHHVDGEPLPSDDVMAQMYADVEAFNTRVQEAGAWVFAGGLQPPDTATVVSPADGSVSDGPANTGAVKLGGFWVIEAPDRESALEWARAGASACRGAVEVRPFQEMPEP